MSRKYYKNRLSFNERISNRRWTVILFSVAFILSGIYYYENENNDNFLMKYISENLWLQTIFIFLAIAGLISIFYPFSIRKELNEKDIINNYEEKIRIEKRNEEIKKEASL